MSEPSRGVAYVDTSALVTLVVREAESDALENALSTWRGLATSSITTIELRRAAQRSRADDREGVADDETIAVLLAAVVLQHPTATPDTTTLSLRSGLRRSSPARPV